MGWKKFQLQATVTVWLAAEGYARSGDREHFDVAIDNREMLEKALTRTGIRSQPTWVVCRAGEALTAG